MSRYALMKCGLNQIQFMVNLQVDWQDLRKWEALIMSFSNFKRAWNVKIQAATQKENLPTMFWFIWLEGYLAICGILFLDEQIKQVP